MIDFVENERQHRMRSARRPPAVFGSADEAHAAGREEATARRHLWVPAGPRANGVGYSKGRAAEERARVRAEHRAAWFEGFWEGLPSESPLHARRAAPHPADGHAELGYASGGLSAGAAGATRPSEALWRYA